MKDNSNKRLFLAQDFVCIILIVAMIGYTFYSMMQMPEMIPIHWSDGVADGWGSKWISLLMPGFILFIYLVSIVYISNLKKGNRPIIIASWLKLGFVILLTIINLFFIQSILG